MPKSSARGYILVWLLIAIACVAAAFTSIGFTSEDGEPASMTTYLVFAGSLVIIALGLVVEGKRDFVGVCKFTSVGGLIVAIITGAVAYLGVEPHPVAAGVAVLTGLIAIASAGYLIRTQLGTDPYPDILREEFGDGGAHEVDGVQFAVAHQTDLRGGEATPVAVFAQNCWDHPRTFVFRLTPSKKSKSPLIVEAQSRMELGPLEVGLLEIPVVAGLNAKGRYDFYVDVRVEGSDGKRLRRRRVEQYQRRTPGWLTAFAAIGGALVFGGGMKVPFLVREPKADAEAPDARPRPPVTKILWSPEQTEALAE